MADLHQDGFGTIFQENGGGGGGAVELVLSDTTLRVNRSSDEEGWGTDTVGEGALNSVVFSGAGESSGAQAVGVGLLSGQGHSVFQHRSVVAGGIGHQILTPDGQESFLCSGILGGETNEIWGSHGVIGGGEDNQIGDNVAGSEFTHYGFIGGGSNNVITGNGEAGNFGFIGAGSDNAINNAIYSSIGAGYQNLIQGGTTTLVANVLGGGTVNQIRASGYAFLGGGEGNEIGDINGEGDISADYAVLVGGESNEIEASHGVIIGGEDNFIDEGASYGVILGGQNNSVTAIYGIASGYAAQARHAYGETFSTGYFNLPGDAQVSRTVLRAASTGASQGIPMGAGPAAADVDFALDPTFTYLWTLDVSVSDTSASMRGITKKGILVYEGAGWHLDEFNMPLDATYGAGVDVSLTITTVGDALRVTLVTSVAQNAACKAVGLLTVVEAALAT